jgi:hypothetical protein
MLIIKSSIALVLGLYCGLLFAADHAEAPQVRLDPAADINDIYAFMNPNDPSELVMVTTVLPMAGLGTQFSDVVEYNFHVSNADTPNEYQTLTCTFPTAGQLSCSLPGRNPLMGNVGEIVTGPDFRVFAGLRDDPFFFDGPATNETVIAGELQFNNPGTNSFAGLDVMAIIIGINPLVYTNGASPILRVYASTSRLGGGTLNGSLSGNFFNKGQPGHGFFFEVIEDGDRNLIFVAWMVFDNNGNPMWLVGQGPIDGLSATVPTQRLSGTNFPPNFDANDIIREDVGTLVFEFSDCNNGTVDFLAADGFEFGSVAFPISRLTTIEGRPCGILKNGQIDRMGRPAINTGLIDLLTSTGAKDRYNESPDPTAWAGLFQEEIAKNLIILDDLDGVRGNALIDPNSLAALLVDDVLLINTSIASCDNYLAVEVGFGQQCGGRTLQRDVIDDTLNVVVGPGVNDGVGDDSVFLGNFPFLGIPNSQ